VDDAFVHPLKALLTALRGPRLSGPMAPDPPVLYGERVRGPGAAVAAVNVNDIRHANREPEPEQAATPRL
jgi:hypothetical protein